MTLSSAKNHLSFLPYDILYQVIGHLGLSDFHNLSRADRTLYNLLQNEQLAKHSIKKHIRYSKEAKWALEGKISYRQAVDRFHNVRHAISTAEPYTAAVLARAATFLYREGVLSYVFNNEIRVLNVHQSSRTEQVVDIHVLLRRMFPACRPCCGTGDRSTQITFLYYSSGILAFLVELNGHEQAWLILLDVSPGCTRRVKYMARLRSTRRLFVRHNANHLFYGVYSAEYTSCGSYYWAVFWVDLKRSSSRAQPPPATLLYGLSGTEIGHNICFEIFDNHFYAVSNVNDSEEEILNWRSYYECACIPPGWDQQKPPKRRIWRRDHLEGPINDTWTEMSLRVDETTGEAMILECRREWREGRSDHVRTYYAERLNPLSEWDNNNNSQETESAEFPVMQAQPTSSSSASFQVGTGPFNITLPRLPLHGPSDEDLKRRERKDKYVHSEYTSDNCTRREFILARTKFRTYHLSGQAFIDLVNDPEPNNRVGAATDRLRLRVNSRKRIISDRRDDGNSDTDGTNAKVKRVKLHNDVEESSSPHASSVLDHDEFSNHVHLWPPDDADENLIKLLCPTRRANNIYAFADERTMIYSVDTETPQEQAIVIISFDPQIWFPCMRNRSRDVSAMHSSFSSSSSSSSSSASLPGLSLLGPNNPKESNKQNKCSILGPSSSSTPCKGAGPGAGTYQSSVRSEPAMHISIDQGYWFDVKR